MRKILIIVFFVVIKSYPVLCSYYKGINDDSLSYYYTIYDSLTADSTGNENLFKRALLEFDGQLWLKRMSLIKQDEQSIIYKNSLQLRGDYYYALGSYITSWNFYSQYLDIEFNRDVYSKMCKSVLIAARYREHDSIVNYWKSSAGEAITAYQIALSLYKQEQFKEALDYVEKNERLFNGVDNTKIGEYLNFFSLKAELLRLNSKDREAATLVRDLAQRFPNSIEMSRWSDLYPFVRSMAQQNQPSQPKATTQKSVNQQQVAKAPEKKVYYTYQLGSFKEAENARRFLSVLKNKYPSYSFYVRDTNSTGKDFYVVTTSRYETEERARNRFENNYKDNIKEDMVFIRIYE